MEPEGSLPSLQEPVPIPSQTNPVQSNNKMAVGMSGYDVRSDFYVGNQDEIQSLQEINTLLYKELETATTKSEVMAGAVTKGR
jgi:hypothetical protein